MSDFDGIIVGSGINSLVCAALLAKGGWKVCLLERSNYLGGAILTEELTQPGYLHERYSAWHPLFVGGGAYQALKADLDAKGVTYVTAPIATASIYADGSSAFFGMDGAANVAQLEQLMPGDGESYQRFLAEFTPNLDLIFGALSGPLWSEHSVQLLKTAQERLGPEGVLRLTGEMLTSCRDWLTQTFRSPKTHGLFAPWISHTGLGPEAALSGMMMRVFAFTLQFVGMPVPRGGGRVLVDALLGIIRDHGGESRTGADVAQVLVHGGRAHGVKLADGETVTAKRAVICNVTPNQLYQRLLSPEQVPAPLDQAVKRFRFGPAGMQLNLAMKEAPKWAGDARLGQSPAVMVNSSLDQVSRTWNEGIRGLLPAEPHLFVGAPSVPDPARAPAGGAVLMIQLLGLPNRPVGDAAGEINVGDGTWTESLREAYADRVMAQLGRHMPNLESALIERRITSPRDLETVNINLVDGDPYGGSLEIAQHYLWRPMPGYPRHATHVPGLYQIGASTFPGHGLGGGSGLLVAQELLR